MSEHLALEAENLHRIYPHPAGDVTALQDVSFCLQAGESMAVCGSSGSGKSTLLNVLGLMDRADRGSLAVAGMATENLSDRRRSLLRRDQIGFVFQSFHLVPELTVLRNVSLKADLNALPDAEAKSRQWLSEVGLGERLKHRPSELSGGQKQRVALARALVHDPCLILADEPTGNLDSVTGEEVFAKMLEMCQQSQSALVLVTHDRRLADRCDQLWLMRDGQLNRES